MSVISKACMAPGTCPDPELCCPEPETPSLSGHMTKAERDELCVALTAPQESVVVQLLLETLPTDHEEV